MSKPVALSLFSGLGGIDIGLHQAGVETAVCIEKDEYAAKTLRANSTQHSDFPLSSESLIEKRYPWTVLEGDLHDLSTDEILDVADVDAEEIDLVVGGPPCQTFSRSNEGNRQGTNEARGMLYEEFARVLEEVQPSAFIFENVRGLASANDGEDFEMIKEELRSKGYRLNDKVVNAANFGVPQTRKRLLVLGLRSDKKPAFPEPTHVEAGSGESYTQSTLTGKQTWVTAPKALEDFDLDKKIEKQGGYTNAVGGKYGYLLKDIPPGANYQHVSDRKYDPEKGEYVERSEDELDEKVFDWRSRHWNYLLKQDLNRPTWTIQASPGTYVGPFHWRSRRFSLLEQMRLMDIPVDYYIAGPPREIQTQIGNAVPPGMLKAIVESLLRQIAAEPDTVETSDSEAVKPDGGEDSVDTVKTEYKVENGTSPWVHADNALTTLKQEGLIHLESRGNKIGNLIDIAELLRRNTDMELDIELEETTIEQSSSKSDVLSKLDAWIQVA